MPQACTLIRTVLAAGSGIGRSTISKGPLGRDTCATRIFAMFVLRLPPVAVAIILRRRRPRGIVPAGIAVLSNRLGRQLLQFSVEHRGDGGDLRVPELAEERGRPVVLQGGLPVLVLVEEHPQRGVQAGPDV